MRFLVLSVLLCLVTSCTSSTRTVGKYDFVLLGPEELACDSELVRQGKNAIREIQGNPSIELCSDVLNEYEDRITENDILNIVIYHPSRRDLMESVQLVNARTGGFKVQDGKVTLPCIDSVEVVGLTLEEARDKLRDDFRREVKDVDVFVSYRTRLSNKVELTGAIANPIIFVDGRIRLYEVLSEARMMPDANLYSSYLVRDGVQLNIDLNKLIREGDMSQNIVMKGGDRIYIGSVQDRASMAMVIIMGGIETQTKAIPLSLGYLSLKEALVMAGGIPFTANRNRIQVIRGGVECPRIYILGWNDVTHRPNDDMLIIPGDLVYVSTTPITDWNLFIQQIAPTVNMLFQIDYIRKN